MTMSIQEISDRLEIQDLFVRYCYAVDDRDWDAYRKAFTPDAIIDDTITGGVRSGVEEHVAFMKQALSKILISQHAISTTLLDIRGDEANARTHCSCPMVVDLGNGTTQVFFSRSLVPRSARAHIRRMETQGAYRGRLLESQPAAGIQVLSASHRSHQAPAP